MFIQKLIKIVLHVNVFEITFKLMKQYDYRVDGHVCCIGFSWNDSTAMCESKDIKDITMMIMTIIAIYKNVVITCHNKCIYNMYVVGACLQYINQNKINYVLGFMI